MAENNGMTVDERLERLTERHEALAQSVEILRDTAHETTAAVSGLRDILAQALGAVKTLAEALENHERRITQIEDSGRA
jgi:methyl-accepting chemotaxis protein